MPNDYLSHPAQPPASTAPALPDVSPEAIPRVANPPAIILKFDDVRQVDGRISERWTRIAEFLEAHGTHGGFGVIAESFRNGLGDAARDWFAARRAAGCVSFWCHGWDHATHVEDGVEMNEFVGRSEADLLERLDRCVDVGRRVLGVEYRTFGPTGGVYGPGISAEALAALKRQKDLRIVLYPAPLDAAARVYDGDPGLRILDRVPPVNVERSVGHPDYRWFLNGYAANPGREVFVLQSHPDFWDDAAFAEFVRIHGFLADRGTRFLTPEEYVFA